MRVVTRGSVKAKAVVYLSGKGYRVDEEGRVFSHTGRMIAVRYPRGYAEFSARDASGKIRSIRVHQFVAYDKFGDEALAVGTQVRHLDGNSRNNRRENIAIGNQSDNMMDKPKSVRLRASKIAASFVRKLSDEDVRTLRSDYASGMSLCDAAKKYGIAKSTASYAINRRTYAGVA